MSHRAILAAIFVLLCAPIAHATTVTTSDSSSTPGYLVCEAGSDGRTITDCGVAPVTTISAYGMLANTSSSAATATVVIPSGAYGVPVLSSGNVTVGYPTFTGGLVDFSNIDDSSNPSRIDISNKAIPTNGAAVDQIFFDTKDSAGTAGVSAGRINAVVDTNTAGALTSHGELVAKTSGTDNYELRWGNGVSIGSASRHGVGTIDATGAYYANGTVGVTCSSGINATTFRSVNGIVTHC